MGAGDIYCHQESDQDESIRSSARARALITIVPECSGMGLEGGGKRIPSKFCSIWFNGSMMSLDVASSKEK